jgi:hypothetical protein
MLAQAMAAITTAHFHQLTGPITSSTAMIGTPPPTSDHPNLFKISPLLDRAAHDAPLALIGPIVPEPVGDLGGYATQKEKRWGRCSAP